MTEGRERHLYPGGNTALGFFSFYNEIITQEEADRYLIIKGGPGVGKSTFMKKIGAEMQSKGYEVEYLHCSSDNNSLDGIKIPALNIAFVDGTAPHVVDPKSPGAVDSILNFGEFWDEKGIRVHKDDIIKTNKEIGQIFARAYKYLKAALCIYEDSAVIYEDALDQGKISLFTNELISEIFEDACISGKYGRQRSLFASAITPLGLCNYLDNLLAFNKIYAVTGSVGTGEVQILEKIKTAALERGLFVEAYYCSLHPGKLEHLIIPALSIAVTTSSKYHATKNDKFAVIDMQQFYDAKKMEKKRIALEQNAAEFDSLLSIALDIIHQAKALHDVLETCYIPNIDFKAIDACFYDIMHRITPIEK